MRKSLGVVMVGSAVALVFAFYRAQERTVDETPPIDRSHLGDAACSATP